VLLPVCVRRNLSRKMLHNWRLRFSSGGGYDRAIRENVWRRHQAPINAAQSGWNSDNDARRRLLHFRDGYGLEDRNFVLKSTYLFLHLKLPKAEIAEYLELALHYLSEGGWAAFRSAGREFRFQRGDLECVIKQGTSCKYDALHKIRVPGSYGYLDLTVRGKHLRVAADLRSRAWTALSAGIRTAAPRGRPCIRDPEDIVPFLPAHVELGCGPAIEAGIPALNHLHRVYGITAVDGTFVLQARDDSFLEILRDPEGKFRQMAAIHSACLSAEPTSFYRTLKRLHDSGYVIGPVFTNNFDGLALSVGLPEVPLRQFDSAYQYPPFSFDHRVRSLIVVGSHADRRAVQRSARSKGLKIIYVDPEGYRTDSGFVSYPIESPQDDDILVRTDANEFAQRLASCLFASEKLGAHAGAFSAIRATAG
jgi:hypothetical protein